MNDSINQYKHTEDFRIVKKNVAVNEKRYEIAKEKWEFYTSTLEVAPAPLHVDIELTNICDLKCIMCERKYMQRPLGLISFDLFKRVVNECSIIGVDSIKLNLWGESLLHPELIKMIRYISENSSIVTQFNTNANRLTSEKSKGLIEAGLDKLTISFDGLSQKTYEAIRVNGNYNKVITNIETLIQNKIRLGSKTPYLTIQIIRMPDNECEIDSFIERWKNEVDFISVTNIGSTAGSNEILSYSLRKRMDNNRVACSQLWQRLSILWDGSVTVCCNDYDGFLKLGRYGALPLTDYWHCERLNELRSKHKKLDFSDLICNRCTETFTYSDI